MDQMGQLVGTTDTTRGEQREQDKEMRILARKKEKEEALKERKRIKERADKETRISEAEEELASVEAELCKEEVYTDPLRADIWSQRLQTVKNELETLYEEWMNMP